MSDRTNQSTEWQFEDGSPEAYEELFVPVIFSPWAERLVDRATIEGDENVLDIACGTGIVARLVARRVGDAGSVVGVDNDEGMLAVATKTAAAAGLSIEWEKADVTDLAFTDHRFDIVFCQQGLPFFEDPRRALVEMRRVVAKDGRVLLNVGRPLQYQPGWAVLADALTRHLGEKWGNMLSKPFPEWDGKYLRELTQDAGFGDITVTIEIGTVRFPSVKEFLRRQAVTSPLAEPIGAAPEAVRNDLLEELREDLHDYVDDDGVVFPFESFVVDAKPTTRGGHNNTPA